MGYALKELKNKKSLPKWKIQYVSHKKSECADSRAMKPKKEWDIPKSRWLQLGLYELLTIDEVKLRQGSNRSTCKENLNTKKKID